MTKLKKKSLNYLRAVHENDGRATTTEIRNRTGMSNSEVNYRHNKLNELGYVDIERDPDLTAYGMCPGKRAILTDYAEKEIDEGLLVKTKQETRDVPSVKSNAERLDDIEETVERARETINDQILPACYDVREIVIHILLILDQSDDIDVSLRELIQLEIDEETAKSVRKRVHGVHEQDE